MRETSKAVARRLKETLEGSFDWLPVFRGKGIDIGSGDDPLQYPDVVPFDLPNDANKLSEYFPRNSMDYCHASQVLEHMHDPRLAIRDWLKVIKPGGYLVVTVPAMELYGDILWGVQLAGGGPNFNLDHKATFSMFLKGSPAPIHIYVPELVAWIEKENLAKCLLSRMVDTNYDYKVMFTKDQTFVFEDGVECWIEMVFKKI